MTVGRVAGRRGRGPLWGFYGTAFAALLITLILGLSVLAVHRPAESVSSFRPTPFQTPETLGSDGIGPTAISLNWSRTGDLWFGSYTLQESSSGSDGPWQTVYYSTNPAATSAYVSGLSPGAAYWWRVIDTDALGTTTISPVLPTTQRTAAWLSYGKVTPTSASFSWSNNASYGGLLAFGSYQLMEFIGSGPGGAYTSAANITNEGDTSITLHGLAPHTSYSFHLVTTDQCNGCAGGAEASPSFSNSVTFGTPSPLSASAITTRNSVDVGEPEGFGCFPAGGVPPYSFHWTFGDGTSGTGQSPAHAYDRASSYPANCTVTDQALAQVTVSVAVVVHPDPYVTTPALSSTRTDVGRNVTISTAPGGGSGQYRYGWTLPTGCRSLNAPTVRCTLNTSGTFPVRVAVTDSNDVTNVSTPAILIVAPLPAITAFSASPQDLTVGHSFTLATDVTGGTQPMTFAYSSLPPGCSSINATEVPCTPSAAGAFAVKVTVTDDVGTQANATANIVVGPASSPPGPSPPPSSSPPPPNSAPPPTFLGFPRVVGYAILAILFGIIAIALATGVVATRRRHRSPEPPPGTMQGGGGSPQSAEGDPAGSEAPRVGPFDPVSDRPQELDDPTLDRIGWD
jgi:hypothetical protein